MTEPALELAGLDPRLPLDTPFTRPQAAAAGLTRSRFERVVRSGHAQRVLTGVYAAPDAPRDEAFRAAAVGLVLRPGVVAVGRTAAWLHGASVTLFSPPGAPPVPTERRPRAALPERDVVQVRGVLATSPLRTCLDLARDDPRIALAAMDRFLAVGLLGQVELLAGLALGPHDGRVRELAAQADGRARCAAESVLRLHWMRSRLPTPTPALVLPGRSAAVRLALGVGPHRFGVLLRSGLDGPDATHDDVERLRAAGWWLAVMDDAQVLRASAGVVRRHLEREYHQSLLREVG